MDLPTPLSRTAQLANGALVPLEPALRHYEALAQLAIDDHSEWDLLYYLRQLCFGRPVETDVLDELVTHAVLDSDRGLDPILREVVLSGVRGAGRSLRVESPFTAPLELAIGEFDAARRAIVELADDRRQAAAILKRHDERERLVGEVLREEWTKRVQRDEDGPDRTGPK